MCGIFGYSFKKDRDVGPAKRALLGANLAMLNDRRGGDSWGMAGLRQGKVLVKRGMGDFVEHVHALTGYLSLFGHTRFATTGEKVIANAHPFEIGNIVGAHNGVISNHYRLNTEHGREFTCDSMHLFGHLDEGKPFSQLCGYGAIEWIDKREAEKIYLCKLSGGSLSIAGVNTYEDPTGVVWSSDVDHLKKALKRAGIRKYFLYKVTDEAIFKIIEGTIWETADKLELGSSWEPFHDNYGGYTRIGSDMIVTNGGTRTFHDWVKERNEKLLKESPYLPGNSVSWVEEYRKQRDEKERQEAEKIEDVDTDWLECGTAVRPRSVEFCLLKGKPCRRCQSASAVEEELKRLEDADPPATVEDYEEAFNRMDSYYREEGGSN